MPRKRARNGCHAERLQHHRVDRVFYPLHCPERDLPDRLLASSDAYLGKPVVVADAISRAMKRAPGMAWGYVYQSVAIGLASLLFIIPGIYVALGLFAMPCIIAFEGLSAGDAASRSFDLSKGLKGAFFSPGSSGSSSTSSASSSSFHCGPRGRLRRTDVDQPDHRTSEPARCCPSRQSR